MKTTCFDETDQIRIYEEQIRIYERHIKAWVRRTREEYLRATEGQRNMYRESSGSKK